MKLNGKLSRRSRLLTAVLTLVMLVALSLNVMAAKSNEVTRDGLTAQLVTNKDSYKTGESVKATVQVDNQTGEKVYVITQMTASDGVLLENANVAFDAILENGESWEAVGGVVTSNGNTAGATAASGSSTATGDNMQAGFYVILTALAVGGIIGLFVYGKNSKTWLSIMLCMAMVGGLVTFAVPAQAADVNGDIQLNCVIQVDGKDAEVKATVSYMVCDDVEKEADEPTAIVAPTEAPTSAPTEAPMVTPSATPSEAPNVTPTPEPGEADDNTQILNDPYFTQDVIDEAVATAKNPTGWPQFMGVGELGLDKTANSGPAEKSTTALYYLTLIARNYPNAKASDGTLCSDAAKELLEFFLAGGNEPMASVGCWWGHAIMANALLLAKNTDVIYNDLTQDTKDRMDWLMKALAIAGNWGYNIENNYETGFDLHGNFKKTWNPNYANSYLSIVLTASMYFGEKELDAIYTSFEYDAYMDQFRAYNFINVIYAWEIAGKSLLEVGTMEDGSNPIMIGGYGLSNAAAGNPAGSGKGVRLPFIYKKHEEAQKPVETDGDKISLQDDGFAKWMTKYLVNFTYNNTVKSSCVNADGEVQAYIISGATSPYEGQNGMFTELDGGDGGGVRSSLTYACDSFIIWTGLRINLELFSDIDFNSEDMQALWTKMYVGNEDMIFKLQEGYNGYSSGEAKIQYEYSGEFTSRGYIMYKDLWRNYICKVNEDVTVITNDNAGDDNAVDDTQGTPEGSLPGKLVVNNSFTLDSYYRIYDNPATSGTVTFDIGIAEGINKSTFDGVVMLMPYTSQDDKKFANANMAIQIRKGKINIRNGSDYVATGFTFTGGEAYAASITFDVNTKKYTVTLTDKETGVSFTAENYAFREGADLIKYVDSLCVVKQTAESCFWLENVKVDGVSKSYPNYTTGWEGNYADWMEPVVRIINGTTVWTDFMDYTQSDEASYVGFETLIITASDIMSDVDTVQYYLAEQAMTLDEVKVMAEGWISADNGVESFKLEAGKEYLIYVKAVDAEGNIGYASKRIFRDKTAPVITGIENATAYCEAPSFKVTDDASLNNVTVNGIVLTPDTDGTYIINTAGDVEVIATDACGNTTTVCIYVGDLDKRAAKVTIQDGETETVTLDKSKKAVENKIEISTSTIITDLNWAKFTNLHFDLNVSEIEDDGASTVLLLIGKKENNYSPRFMIYLDVTKAAEWQHFNIPLSSMTNQRNKTTNQYASWNDISDMVMYLANYGKESGVDGSTAVMKNVYLVKEGAITYDKVVHTYGEHIKNDCLVQGTTNTYYKSCVCGKTSEETFYFSDNTAPVIAGIENGTAYCVAPTITITDNTAIDTVKVNGTIVEPNSDETYTISATGAVEVIAADVCGNTTTVCIYVGDLDEIEGAITYDKVVHTYGEHVDEKYLVSDTTNTYYKSCVCGEKSEETFSVADKVAPTIQLVIGQKSLTSSSDESFTTGTAEATITAEDASGIAGLYYYVSTELKSQAQIKALPDTSWTTVAAEDGKVTLFNSKGTYYVYVKAVDKAEEANTTYLSTGAITYNTTSIIYYKDDYNSYDAGKDASELGISVDGDTDYLTVTTAKDNSGGYLVIKGSQKNSNGKTSHTISIPLKENGEAITYNNEEMPLWIDMSFRKYTNDNGEEQTAFNKWYISVESVKDSTSKVNNLLQCSQAPAILDVDENALHTFNAASFEKVIIKLDFANEMYYLWLREYSGNAVYSGSFKVDNISKLVLNIASNNKNYARELLADNIAIFASEEYYDVFGEGIPGTDVENPEAPEWPLEGTPVSATFEDVYNGANGIVSMTFDDGKYDTAVWLDEKLKYYGLRASTMMITNKNFASDEVVQNWKTLFAKGNLEAESHSYSHIALPAPYWSDYENNKANNTEENYTREIVTSKEQILQVTGRTPLCYAPSNNTLSDGAMEMVTQHYYAMRQGRRAKNGNTQSLDPEVGLTYKNGTTGKDYAGGGWYDLYMASFEDEGSETTIPALIKDAAENGSWLITMCHGIVASEGYPAEKATSIESFFELMFEHQEKGELWVTTFGDAVKYIRERQNSSVKAVLNEDGIYVNVTMSEMTADNLPLAADIFNHPLTVKVEVDNDVTSVSYMLSGSAKTVDTFTENNKTYVYVNVVPNEENILLTLNK